MNTHSATRRRPWARWLMLALLVVPVVEVFIIIKVGQNIGGLNTLALLLLWSAIGAWIVKREFGRAFGALQQAFASGRMPAKELADGALVLIGGTLLLAPGFLTDVIGLFFLAPFTRPLMRRVLEGAVASRLFGGILGGADVPRAGTPHVHAQPYPTPDAFGRPGSSGGFTTDSTRAPRSGQIIEGEIID